MSAKVRIFQYLHENSTTASFKHMTDFLIQMDVIHMLWKANMVVLVDTVSGYAARW